MLPYPLSRANRLQLARAFAQIPRVDISIDCVLEDQMGKAFVDAPDNPRFFMIELDNFFCYFAGDFRSAAGHDFLAQSPSGRMLMAGAEAWQENVEAIFAERLIKITRHNYLPDTLALSHIQQLKTSSPQTKDIRRVDLALAQSQPPFLEFGAFDSPADFVERGIGFCLLKDDKVLGAAYSSLVSSRAIEVSVIVDPAHYRQGIATALCAHLLEFCLENGLSAHWDAANEESCHLAEKLGYHKLEDYTAYFLKASA